MDSRILSNPAKVAPARLRRGVVIASPEGLGGGGGMGSVTRAMTRWLKENRPDLKTVVIDPRGERFGTLWPLRLLLSSMQLVYLRLRHHPEILHLQVSQRSSFTRKGVLQRLAKALGMRTVLHHHGSQLIPFYESARPSTRGLVRKVVHEANMNIVLGDKFRRFLVDAIELPNSQVVTHFNATDDLGSVAPIVDRDPWNILIVANLMPRKGVGELLLAVSQLALQGFPIRLTLAGGGEIDRYRSEARELGIADRCVFTGWISGTALHSLLVEHGMLILPSFGEGLPMAILEALSARLPVIATRVGSIPEVLEAGETCLFVEPGNVAEIAAAIVSLATDQPLRDRLSEKGRQLYEERFDIGAYMRDMLTLYEDVLANRR